MAPWSTVVIFYLLKCCLFVNGQGYENTWTSLLAKMSKDPDLSEFYATLERNVVLNATLGTQGATIFAPTNEAFQKSKIGDKDDNLLYYHIVFTPYTFHELPSGEVLTPAFYPQACLRITGNRNGDKYVNNALILKNLSQSFGRPENNGKVLHVINEVLSPLRDKRQPSSKPNPTAWGLLENFDNYKIGPYQIGSFASRVRAKAKEDVFRDPGPNTYFIPIDDAMRKAKIDAIDEKVIDAHVIPKRALFLNPTSENDVFETTAFGDNVKITVSLPAENIQNNKKRFAKSNTRIGDPNHPSGVMLSEIVYGNIPLQNGVAHFIRQPLAVVDKTVQQNLDEGIDSLFGTFKDKLKYASQFFRNKLSGSQGITLFVPTNAAWRDANVERALNNNTTLLSNILNLHLVTDKLTTTTIRERGLKEAPTLYERKFVYFNVIVQGLNHTLTVEAGGVNSTAVFADLAATNGVIHVIDRVLGIPFATVGRKLATDPLLNFTYSLGRYQNFNDRLDNISQNYTYFVPRDAAWKLFEVQYPQLFAALSKPQYAYQVLERHLITSGNYTMADLKKIASDTIALPTSRGGLNIRVKEDPLKGYIIEWNGDSVPVSRADVRCTNGIIHVIDKVLIRPGDINVPVGGAMKNNLGIAALLMVMLPLSVLVYYH